MYYLVLLFQEIRIWPGISNPLCLNSPGGYPMCDKLKDKKKKNSYVYIGFNAFQNLCVTYAFQGCLKDWQSMKSTALHVNTTSGCQGFLYVLLHYAIWTLYGLQYIVQTVLYSKVYESYSSVQTVEYSVQNALRVHFNVCTYC